MNNDPFKKMDLNFDPTVEAKVETEKPVGQNINPQNQNVQPQPQVQQPIEHVQANEYAIKQEQRQIEEIKNQNQGKDMERTVEFIVQDDPKSTDEDKGKQDLAKAAEKKAKKHRLYSFWWIFIIILSLIFGVESIWKFVVIMKDFVGQVTAEDTAVLDATWTFIQAFFNSFGALLFSFFIFLSVKKYHDNHKPWKEWWIDTEPLRIKEQLKKEVENNIQLRVRANALRVSYLPIPFTGTTDKEELEHVKEENSNLAGLIKIEEQRIKSNKKK